ncbi:MAG: DUF1501 domain-containing protein [Pseudomonadales bacterium]|nr:DUF1501 domain-containing protein [Pseudomonadales bacterium]
MFDPKGADVETYRGPMNRYASNAIRQKGKIRYAPIPQGVESSDQLDKFVQKYYRKMMVINGINQATNSHSVGARLSYTGSQSSAMPTLPAMLASPYADSQPMAFITAGGGYNFSGGLVAKSQLLDDSQFNALANPDKYLNSDAVNGLLNSQKQQQLQRLLADTPDNAIHRLLAMRQLHDARRADAGVDKLLNALPQDSEASGSKEDAEMIAAAFATGWATTATLGMGGFDTHNDSDNRQFKKIDELLSLVDHLWQELERVNIADKTTVVLVSDMGRTPGYNSRDGKDHWPTNSMVLMGAGIEGNRTIGGTDDALRPKKVNAHTLQLDEDGIEITPAAIYKGLRRLSGIDGGFLDRQYVLDGDYIDLFSL